METQRHRLREKERENFIARFILMLLRTKGFSLSSERAGGRKREKEREREKDRLVGRREPLVRPVKHVKRSFHNNGQVANKSKKKADENVGAKAILFNSDATWKNYSTYRAL